MQRLELKKEWMQFNTNNNESEYLEIIKKRKNATGQKKTK